MSLSLILACLWALVANVLAMTPSRDFHWRNAYILIAIGIPIVGYVVFQHGPWIGLLVLAGGLLGPALAGHLSGPLAEPRRQ